MDTPLLGSLTLTHILAILGTLGGLTGTALSLWQHWSNRPAVRMVFDGDVSSSGLAAVDVTNAGSRPTSLVLFRVEFRRRIQGRWWRPRTLQEGWMDYGKSKALPRMLVPGETFRLEFAVQTLFNAAEWNGAENVDQWEFRAVAKTGDPLKTLTLNLDPKALQRVSRGQRVKA
jgi:hypothetical protein